MTNKYSIEPSILVLTSLLVVGYLFFSNAYAFTDIPTKKINLLAIEYSQSCQTMLKHNVTTSCPTLDKIWKYDTTNKDISGKLVLSKGILHRSLPQVKNHFLWYDSGPTKVCVDCSVDLILGFTKTIFIEPSDFTYVDKSQLLRNAINYTIHTNPYISHDCLTATLGYSNYLLNDTINYMLNNCTGPHFLNNQTNNLKQTPFSFDNPYSTLHYQKQIQQLKASTVKNCITSKVKCDQPKDPYRKAAWG